MVHNKIESLFNNQGRDQGRTKWRNPRLALYDIQGRHGIPAKNTLDILPCFAENICCMNISPTVERNGRRKMHLQCLHL